MQQNNFSEFYKNSPFTEEENQKLNSSFLDFGEIWNITISFIKRDFKRVILIPTLWQLLIGVGFVVFIGVFAFGTFVSLVPNLNSYNSSSTMSTYSKGLSDDNTLIERNSILDRNNTMSSGGSLYNTGPTGLRTNPDLTYGNTPKYNDSSSSGSAIGMVGVFGLFFIMYFAIIIVFALINLRQRYILNDSTVESIWKTPRGFYIDLLKFIALGIMYFVLYLIVVFVSSIFSAAGAPFLGILIEWAFSLVIFGFFGLSTHLIVYEKADIGESISTSYKLMKPVFWKNVLRYLIFTLIVIAIYLCVALVTVILAFVIYFALAGLFSSPAMAPLIFFLTLIGIVYFSVIFIGVYSLRFVFEYISFYNIRMLKEANVANISETSNPDAPKTTDLQSSEAKTEVVANEGAKDLSETNTKEEVEPKSHHATHHHSKKHSEEATEIKTSKDDTEEAK